MKNMGREKGRVLVLPKGRKKAVSKNLLQSKQELPDAFVLLCSGWFPLFFYWRHKNNSWIKMTCIATCLSFSWNPRGHFADICSLNKLFQVYEKESSIIWKQRPSSPVNIGLSCKFFGRREPCLLKKKTENLVTSFLDSIVHSLNCFS